MFIRRTFWSSPIHLCHHRMVMREFRAEERAQAWQWSWGSCRGCWDYASVETAVTQVKVILDVTEPYSNWKYTDNVVLWVYSFLTLQMCTYIPAELTTLLHTGLKHAGHHSALTSHPPHQPRLPQLLCRAILAFWVWGRPLHDRPLHQRSEHEGMWYTKFLDASTQDLWLRSTQQSMLHLRLYSPAISLIWEGGSSSGPMMQS